MKIELKNVRHHHSLTEETLAFTANIYIDGIKMGQAKNTGNGGMTIIIPFQGKRELYEKAVKHTSTLPTEQIECDGHNFAIQPSLDSLIDQLVENDLIKKDQAAFERKIKKTNISAICFGPEDKRSYKSLKLPMPIEDLLLQKGGKAYLLKRIGIVKKEMQPGDIIYNNNIPAELLN